MNFTWKNVNLYQIRFYILLCLITIGVSFLFKDILLTDSLYYEAYGEQLSYERISQYLENRERYEWVIFIAVPLLNLIRFTLVALCLFVGVVLLNKKARFVSLFQVVMVAEIIHFAPRIITFLWFYFFVEDYALKDLSNFYPYSLLALFDKDNLAVWWAYPIYLLNLIELSYWLLLAYGLRKILQSSFEEMLIFVASTYGIGLLLWVIFVVFLQVMAS